MDIEPEHWGMAFARVAAVERRSSILKRNFRRRKFTYALRSAWATTAGFDALPEDQQPGSPGIWYLQKRVSAESVLIGKSHAEREVRLRAFYPRQGLCMRYQAGGHRNAVSRTVTAYNLVQPHAAELISPIFDHGIVQGNGAYLVESIQQGQPATHAQLQELITPLASRLHRVHQGVGIRSMSVVNILGTDFASRWSEFAETTYLDPRMDKAVRQLVARNNQLEVSLTHGNLVGPNILVSDHDFVLMNWEHAEFKPIAFDLARILVDVSDVESMATQMHAAFHGNIGSQPDHYTLREQIALTIALTLSWYTDHAAKAAAAGRMPILERLTMQRVNAVHNLLGLR